MKAPWPVLAIVLAGCGGDGSPAWAIDPIWIEPTEQGIHGFQTWELYEARWERTQKPSTFVCTVLVELEGVETECTDCQLAWSTTGTVLQSDCPQSVIDQPMWTALGRLSLGLAVTDADVEIPGKTNHGFADYGFGWEVHGVAWPDAVTAPDGTWDGETPFRFAPELAWPL